MSSNDAIAENKNPAIIIQDDSHRPYLFLTYFCFTLLMIPVWWFTTSVSRVSLTIPSPPSVSEKSTGQATMMSLRSTIKVTIIGGGHRRDYWDSINDMQFTVSPDSALSRTFRVKLMDMIDGKVVEEINLKDHMGINQIWKVLPSTKEELPGNIHFYIIDNNTHSVGEAYDLYFYPERRIILFHGGASKGLLPGDFIQELVTEAIVNMASVKTSISDSPAYQINLNLVVGYLPSDDGATLNRPIDWEAQKSAQKWILPLVEELRNVADFSVNIQVRPFVEFTAKVSYRDDRYYVNARDAIRLTDENQIRLGRSINDSKNINFVLYVPPPSFLPFHIEGLDDAETHQVISISEWGAMVFAANLPTDSQVVSAQYLDVPFRIFANKLREMFIPTTGIKELDYPSFAKIHPIRLDALMIEVFHKRYRSARDTLQALQRLLEQNSEIVVEPVIRKLVARSLADLAMARNHLQGGELTLALSSATMSLQLTDSAFFHPTMMAHQYFPQEHKLGVYLPLVFPLVLPVILASLVALVALLKKKKKKKQGNVKEVEEEKLPLSSLNKK